MLFATWGEGSPVAVIVDPFTKKKEGKIDILVSLFGDVGVLREEFSAFQLIQRFNKKIANRKEKPMNHGQIEPLEPPPRPEAPGVADGSHRMSHSESPIR